MPLDTQQLKQSKERILEVAAKLFAERGYANVSIREICKEADVTLPMVYYYFRNKKGLFQAVTRHKVSMNEFIESLKKATSRGSAKEKVRSFTRFYLSSFPEDAFNVGFYIDDDASLDKESAKKVSESFMEIQELLEKLIKDGEKEGVFREGDADVAADMLLGLLNHVLFQKIHFEREFVLESSVQQVTDFFFRAMKPGL